MVYSLIYHYRIEASTEKYVIGNIYRHPGSQYKYFCERLCNTLEILHKSKTKYILVGDYNISALKYNLCTDVTNCISSLNSVGCHIHVDKPTRIAENTASCIDHVYSNFVPNLLENYIVQGDISAIKCDALVHPTNGGFNIYLCLLL